MPTKEVIRHLGEKLRELISDDVVATTEMQALVWRLALMETHVDVILGWRSQMLIPNSA
jgi:hypothetical protein